MTNSKFCTPILQVEIEKRQLKREVLETKREAGERLTKETSDYVNRLCELRLKNQKLNAKLDDIQKEKDEWYTQMQEEQRLKIGEFKIDMDVLREENKKLSLQVKDLRREEMKVNPRVETEAVQLRQEIDMLRNLTEKLKSQYEQDHKQFTLELEESEKRNSKLHREIDQLRKDLNQAKADSREENNELDRKATKLEEKNKRLVTEVGQYKKENERLVGDQQQLKNIAESDLRRKIEKIANLEQQVGELESKNERTEDKLRSSNYDLKQAKLEIERLMETLESLKKEKLRLIELEKQELVLIADAKRKETELNNEIETIYKSLDSWKEKAKSSELRVQDLTMQLAHTSDQVKSAKGVEERLNVELGNVLGKV